MCNKKEFFVEYDAFQKPGEVTIGDGHVLEVVGCGTVSLNMRLPGNTVQCCVLRTFYTCLSSHVIW